MLPLRFDQPFASASRLFGVSPATAGVDVVDGRLVARFGPWRVVTPVANVASARVTGPYAWWKVIGPAHLSLADRGLTFATTDRGGVCLSFHHPVHGIEPTGRLRHPGLTVTVADPSALLDLLAAHGVEVDDHGTAPHRRTS
jgi:hypothetical protein